MEQDITKLKGAIEAVLFAIGEPVTVEQLSLALELDEDTIRSIVHQMMEQYDDEERGIRIIEIEDGFQLCTKNEYYEELSKIVNIPKKHMLTDVQLETLSIIAYKQPITRTEIEAIRGVSCVHAINKLVEYHLIEEVGRLDAIGKPILFGTTEDFLRGFGVKSTDDLPVITPDKIADFEQQAIAEASVALDT
ncbi:MAG: SMC-Scp complex subunit ScpB [Lachnospiraceae bacterium]|nr:SMC-Scp complex subunit ScpB [Lachnospiraceae bacterium]